jgi:hypothetical protein
MFNRRVNSSATIDTTENRCWGFDSVNLGQYLGQCAYIARGQWRYGYLSRGQERGFVYVSPTTPGIPFIAQNSNYETFYQLSHGGSIELGYKNTSGTLSLDFNTSGNNLDYDARIVASGGNATLGQATLQLRAGEISTDSIRPVVDNNKFLGNATNRWTVVYAATGTINTSDAREKQQIRDLTEQERRAAVRIKSLVRAFKFNDAVNLKGDSARIHFGVIAQDVKSALEAEGLDPFSYAMLCYDEWSERRDESGNVATSAGNRYGVRYEELLAFLISAL